MKIKQLAKRLLAQNSDSSNSGSSKRVTNSYELLRRQHDVLALQQLLPLSASFTPWTDSAMRPAGLITVLNDIVINQRTSIVECGGGITTLYIARLLRHLQKGHLYTIEHDQTWANRLQNWLVEDRTHDFATIVQAPLQPSSLAINADDWYDSTRIHAAGITTIDLLLVDGPPAYRRQEKYARYPALPHFHPLMGASFTIILDDIDREGEQEIVHRWQEQYGMRFERRVVRGNIAISRSDDSYYV